MSRIVCFLILLYQRFISPLFMSRCRFYPSCSSYAKLAFEQHSFTKAVYLTLKRLMCCHPFNKGGIHIQGLSLTQTKNLGGLYEPT